MMSFVKILIMLERKCQNQTFNWPQEELVAGGYFLLLISSIMPYESVAMVTSD